MVERVLKCRKCGEKQPPSKMRYLQDTKNLICIDCVRKIKNPPKEEEVKKEADNKGKSRYKCQKCKHIFMIKEGYQKQCPFCSGFNLILQEWNSDLDALIKDSSKSIYD